MSLLKMGFGLVQSKFGRRPFSANFKVTERCNLRCPMCSIWRRSNKSTELSTDAIVDAAGKLAALGLSRIVLTGGEPLVREDIVSIVDAFARRGFSVTLLTNGLLVRDILLKQLFDAGLEHIGFSLDFLTPERQDAFYNHPGAWKKISTAIQSARERNTRGFVYIMSTLLPENINDIIPLSWLARGWGAHMVLNPVMASAETEPSRIFSGGSTGPVFSSQQREALALLYNELIRLKERGHAILSSEAYLRFSRDWVTGMCGMAWNCHAGSLYFNVFSDGGVAVCNEYPPLISVTDDDFIEKFNAPSFQDKARTIRESCSGCNFSCWRELSLLLTDNRVLFRQMMSLLRQRN